MANYAVGYYNSLSSTKTAIGLVDETKQLHLLGFMQGANQKIGVVKQG
jgi:hypothetical protein